MDLSRLLRPHLKDLKAYSSARDEFEGEAHVFLDANENPYGSAAGDEWNRYPDPHQKALKEVVSELKRVPVDSIFLGNGSDEPIDLLIRAFCEPKQDRILSFPPTYGMYNVSAGIHGIPIDMVLLTRQYQLDMPAIRQAISDRHKLTFLCSPNNPSGNDLNREEMEDVLRLASGLVVVDEAYIDFSSSGSFTEKMAQYPNLVVLQTFSKAWGMAALRVGMAFAHPNVVAVLNKIKPPYNISGPIQQLALDSVAAGRDQVRDWTTHVLKERQRLDLALREIGLVKTVHPTDANFFLVAFEKAGFVFDELTSRGIIVRDRRSHPLCEDCLRLTVGTTQENDELLAALKELDSTVDH